MNYYIVEPLIEAKSSNIFEYFIIDSTDKIISYKHNTTLDNFYEAKDFVKHNPVYTEFLRKVNIGSLAPPKLLKKDELFLYLL